MSATLHALPVVEVKSIAAQLRDIADAIEQGTYGYVHSGALVLGNLSVEVFALGSEEDGTVAHYLLARGQRKLERVDFL
jgi:hypothetical protein